MVAAMPSPSDHPFSAASHSPGEVLALISSGSAATRADIARLTGLARSTVSQRVDVLIAHGFVDEDSEGGSTGGRPPRRLTLRTREHVVAGIDLGASHCRVALMDIGGTMLATQEDPLSISDGPDLVLRHVERTLRTLLKQSERDPANLRSIGSECRARWSSPPDGLSIRRSCRGGTSIRSRSSSPHGSGCGRSSTMT
ncbi:ROK family transcriptional regulator [Streptomyces sp. M10(2022)]